MHELYHEYLLRIAKEHEAIEGPEAEVSFLQDASVRILQLVEHAKAYMKLEAQRASLDAMAENIGLITDTQNDDQEQQTEQTRTETQETETGAQASWTTDEIRQLKTVYPVLSKRELLDAFPRHTYSSIWAKGNKLGLSRPISRPKRVKQDYDPEPEETEQDSKNNLHPSAPGVRFKTMRLYNRESVADIARATSVQKSIIYDIENGVTTPSSEIVATAALHWGITADDLLNAPIGRLIPYSPSLPTGEKIRALRSFAGLSETVLAKRMGLHPREITSYESASSIHDDILRKFADALGVSHGMLAYQSTPNEMMTTAEKIATARKRASMSVAELADKAGCSVTHINNIEAQRGLPSENMLASIARALGTTPDTLKGLAIVQPAAMWASRSERAKQTITKGS